MIPIGTVVMYKEYQWSWDKPEKLVLKLGKIMGYDMSHTKYHIAPHLYEDKFCKEGIAWPFKSWVTLPFFFHG